MKLPTFLAAALAVAAPSACYTVTPAVATPVNTRVVTNEQVMTACAAKIIEQTESGPQTTTIFERFLSATGLSEADKQEARRLCSFFESGLAFGLMRQRPPTPPFTGGLVRSLPYI